MGVNCGSAALCASKNSNSVKWIDKRSAQGGGVGGGRGAKEDAREQEQRRRSARTAAAAPAAVGGTMAQGREESGGVGAHIIGPTIHSG